MPIETIDTFNVGKTAKFVTASAKEPSKIFNAYGGDLFYKVTSDVGSGDTKVEVGHSVTTEVPYWIISTTECAVIVEHVTSRTSYDETVTEKLAVTGTSAFTGAITPTGGVVTPTAAPGFYAGGWPPSTAESGTDTTPAEKKLFVTSLFLPVNKKIKGIGYLVGSVGGTNKAVAGLWSAAGKLLAHTSETTEGATVGTAKEMQEMNLTAEYSAVGPAVYFVGVTMNGNTARLRTIPKNTAGSNVLSEEITIAAKNTLADIAAPTAFAADKGMVGWVF